jgi:putative component of toxin-antitoxin plasmid stabilization module
MDDSKIELLEYLTEDGDNPFHNWLNSLKDRFARARIRVRLNRVRLGNFGDCKPGGSKKSQPKDIQSAQAYWADFQRRAK